MEIFKKIWARASSSDKYITGSRSSFFVNSGTVISEDSAMQVAAFNRGLIYISTQIAKLPWDVKGEDNKKIKGPIDNLLNLRANPEMNSFQWRLFMVQQAIIHGNSYSEIERDGAGRVIALWPLYSRNMSLVRSTSGDLFYRYDDPQKGFIYLSKSDVFHLQNFHKSRDGLYGQGVVGFGRDVLGIQIAADRMAAGMFHNSGVPSGVLSHPGKLSDEAFARLKESWIAQQGRKKSGSTSILEEGLKYEPISTDADALQFLESRAFGVLEIARFLGIPPTKLFDVTASTYSNVEQSNLEVATDTLDSWATNLEMEADVKILNNRFGGRFTDVDLYSIFRGDMKSRSDYFKTMMGIGAMTPNQIREREGMPSYDEGDNYYIATNNFTPVDKMDELIDAEIDSKKNKGNQSNQKSDSEKLMEKAVIDFLSKKD